jgi:hypothetical protein
MNQSLTAAGRAKKRNYLFSTLKSVAEYLSVGMEKVSGKWAFVWHEENKTLCVKHKSNGAALELHFNVAPTKDSNLPDFNMSIFPRGFRIRRARGRYDFSRLNSMPAHHKSERSFHENADDFFDRFLVRDKTGASDDKVAKPLGSKRVRQNRIARANQPKSKSFHKTNL